MELYLSEIYKLFNQRLQIKDRKIHKVSTDTRTLKKNDIFVALKGEKDDGHKYVNEALEKGALAVIVEKKIKNENEKIIKVKNTKLALLQLAKFYLKKFKNLKKVAITGSNGKTTTKEIIAKILSRKFSVLKSEKNYNNYIGLSKTIFNLNKKHEILVIEVGMNHKGEIKEMVKGLDLDMALITNIGTAHIGFFKNKAEIAKAKSEIFCGLKRNGIAILNLDDEYFNYLKNKAKNFKIFTFGKNDTADIRFEKIGYERKYMKFNLFYNEIKEKFKTLLKGEHNLYNISAGILVSLILNMKMKLIKEIVEKFKLKNFSRFEEKIIKGIRVINDAYNANVESYKCAIETLKEMKIKNLIIIAADMLELGKKAKGMHIKLGEMLSQLNLKALFLYGKFKNFIKQGFISNKKEKVDIICAKDKKEIAKKLLKIIKRGDTVFLKGSRKNKLEEIENYLKKGVI